MLFSVSRVTLSELGTIEIEGIKVTGSGFTRMIATSGVPNSEMREIHWEQWRSPDLGVTVLAKASDALNGERSVRLKNISRAEPDASLFQVPAGYTVQDEKRIFDITYTLRR